MSVSFFSSPIGLGHATRDIAVADSLRGIPTSFVSGSGAAKILRNTGHDVRDVYRPPSFTVEGGSLKHSAKWLWTYYKYYKECKGIARRILAEDDPRLVVSDEDYASLAVAQDSGIPTVLITDILETRFTRGLASIVEKRMNRSMQDIIEKCDAVILPEDGDSTRNIRRVGPIVRRTEQSREQLRRRFGFEKATVLVSIGGTDAGVFLIEEAITAISKINQDVEMVLVSGPSVNGRFEGVRDMGFIRNLHEAVFAADVLVSLAGKSTIDEARAYGTPGIFIPIRGHFEQEDNARGEGFVFDDIHRLDELVLAKLSEPRTGSDTGGAARAAGIISDAIKD